MIRPCIVDGIIAPTKCQRLKYIKWLHIYGKDCTRITPRMKTLLERYKLKMKDLDSFESVWYRGDGHLCDVFEPNYLEPAFTRKPLVLGQLIFGREKWLMLSTQFRLSSLASSTAKDPLTQMFQSRSMDKYLLICIVLYIDFLYRSIISFYSLGLEFL